MAHLTKLAAVEQLSPVITRILGCNPSSFTLQGTNTYLLGSKPPFLLIDTGQGEAAYTELLRNHLRSFSGTSLISDIVLTHWHGDHTQGLPAVLGVLEDLDSPRPRIHKWPEPSHDADLPSSSSYLTLNEGQRFPISGTESSLQILNTPGHSADSICLLLAGQGLFTADTVLGEGTAVFENLKLYMESLAKVEEVLKNHNLGTLFPGHGPVRADGQEYVKNYRLHRLEREKQIVRVLEQTMDLASLTKEVYKDQQPPLTDRVLAYAANGIKQHLDKLEIEGTVRKHGDSYVLASKQHKM